LKEKEKKGKMELDLSGQLSRLQEEINDLFHSNWGPRDVLPRSLGGNRTEQSKATFTPKVDISETAKEVRISVDLPGVQKNDIKLETSGNRLTLSGSRVKLELEQDELYRTEERPYGQFNRSIRLPKIRQRTRNQCFFQRWCSSNKNSKGRGSFRTRKGSFY